MPVAGRELSPGIGQAPLSNLSLATPTYLLNTLRKYATNIEDPITDAIGDFPQRNIAVSTDLQLRLNIVLIVFS